MVDRDSFCFVYQRDLLGERVTELSQDTEKQIDLSQGQPSLPLAAQNELKANPAMTIGYVHEVTTPLILTVTAGLDYRVNIRRGVG